VNSIGATCLMPQLTVYEPDSSKVKEHQKDTFYQSNRLLAQVNNAQAAMNLIVISKPIDRLKHSLPRLRDNHGFPVVGIDVERVEDLLLDLRTLRT
jgi:hypothetical protein